MTNERHSKALHHNVRRRTHDKSHCNPLLDTCQYEIKLEDGTTDRCFANSIAENLSSQVDSEECEFLVMKEICNHQTNQKALKAADGYTISMNGNKVPKHTITGWKLLVEFNDNTTTWIPLKDLKDSNPIELAEYLLQIR